MKSKSKVKSQKAKVKSKGVAPLIPFLGFVSALFIGILIFAYVTTKRTTIVMLDERGAPVRTR
jgi:hypothetical protein